MRRTLVISLLIFSALAVLAIFYFFNKPHRNISNETAIAITADSLFKAYENENNANALYLDKALTVSGLVNEMSKNQQGQDVILLRTDDPLFGVACTVKKGQTVSVKQGEKITVKGICSGYTSDVVLRDCIVEAP